MKIVIDIPDWQYKSICKGIEASKRCGVVGPDPVIQEAVYKGTPLPEGHDRLIYADDVKENHKRWIGYLDEDMIARLNIAIDKYVPTIIEADKEE